MNNKIKKVTACVLGAAMAAQLAYIPYAANINPNICISDNNMAANTVNVLSDTAYNKALSQAQADNKITKDESVFVTLDASGNVNSQTVSDWLHCDAGLSDVQDISSLTNIVNLKGIEQPTLNGQNITWNTQNNDIYYQGSTQNTPPITAHITYNLDGKDLLAQDAIGKSGQMIITVSLTNNEVQQKYIDGAMRTVHTPFVTAVGTNLNTDVFKNVQAENGIVQTDSSNQIVGFVCMPGMAQNFDGLLDDTKTDVQAILGDTVTIKADVTNFTAPSIVIAYAADSSLILQNTEFSDIDGIAQQLNTLNDATQQLIDGAQKLQNGAGDLQNGAGMLLNGAATAQNGAVQLSDGLNILNQKSTQLIGGVQQSADGVLQLANAQLQATMGQGTPVLTWQNYTQVLQSLIGINDEMLASAKQTISQNSNLTGETLDALILLCADLTQPTNPDMQQCNTAITQAANMLETAQGATADGGSIKTAQQDLAVYQSPLAVPNVIAVLNNIVINNSQGQILDGENVTEQMRDDAFAQLAQALQGQGVTDSNTQYLIITMACNSIMAGGDNADVNTALTNAAQTASVANTVSSAVTLASAPTPQSCEKINSFLKKLVLASNGDSITALTKLLNLLDAQQTIISGIGDYTDGVAAAAQGAAALKNGIASLYNGINTLKLGTDSLADGTKTLAEGINQYNNEGIAKITQAVNANNLQTVIDIAKQMKLQQEEYASYTGAPQDAITTVKFIMKTQQITENENTSETVSDDTDTKAKTNFFQRVINLFKGN